MEGAKSTKTAHCNTKGIFRGSLPFIHLRAADKRAAAVGIWDAILAPPAVLIGDRYEPSSQTSTVSVPSPKAGHVPADDAVSSPARAHSVHLSRLRSAGISMDPERTETSTTASHPRHVTSIAPLAKTRMLARVIAGPVYTHCRIIAEATSDLRPPIGSLSCMCILYSITRSQEAMEICRYYRPSIRRQWLPLSGPQGMGSVSLP
jgi:hypothetical protein